MSPLTPTGLIRGTGGTAGAITGATGETTDPLIRRDDLGIVKRVVAGVLLTGETGRRGESILFNGVRGIDEGV